MHLILTGATGLVGSAVLDAMLKTPAITQITLLSRRPVAQAAAVNDPRVRLLLHSDFGRYDADVLAQLRGAAGCVWALGISQSQVGKDDYVRITQTYPVEAAKAFAGLFDGFRFVYVSGEGATHTPGGLTPLFGRVKGATERALADLSSLQADVAGGLRVALVRPGMVDDSGHAAIAPYVPARSGAYAAAEVLIRPVIRVAYRRGCSPTEPLGRFLTEMAMGRWDERRLGGPGVEMLGESPIVTNAGFRRLTGLSTS